MEVQQTNTSIMAPLKATIMFHNNLFFFYNGANTAEKVIIGGENEASLKKKRCFSVEKRLNKRQKHCSECYKTQGPGQFIRPFTRVGLVTVCAIACTMLKLPFS